MWTNRETWRSRLPWSEELQMLVRMFGLFGVILASGYLIQGVSYVRFVLISVTRGALQTLAWQFAIMSLDFFFGITLMIAAIGLLFVQEWARKAWLIIATALVFVHLMVIVLSQVGPGVSTFYLIWVWMVLLSTTLSWWYLTKPAIRERFSPAKETPDSAPSEEVPDIAPVP
jgi:hypothetical protein